MANIAPLGRAAGTTVSAGVAGANERRRMTQFTGLATLAVFVLGVAVLIVGLKVRGAFQTITRDSVPSIIAAQDLRAQVQDMDADLANTVLENGQPGPGSGHENWLALRSTSAKLALDDIAKAQANVTFAGECQAVGALRDAFVDYTGYAAQTEAVVTAGGGKLGDASNPAAIGLYGKGAAVLLNRVEPALVAGDGTGGVPLPANPPGPIAPGACAAGVVQQPSSAGGLYTVNAAHEQAAYDSGRTMISRGIAIVVVLGLLLIALVALVNARLASLSHRYLNLGLAGGAIAGAVLLVFGGVQFYRLDKSFKVVSKDSLDSIKLALNMKSAANLANADESRWLFDTANAGSWQADFDAQTQKVGVGANGGGYIAAARENITFFGERSAIDGTEDKAARPCGGGLCKAWNDYLAIDKQIRDAQKASDHLKAVTLNLTTSNAAFGAFTRNVNDLQQVNIDHYTSEKNSAESSALITAVAGIVLAVLGAAAVVLGMRARLSEL